MSGLGVIHPLKLTNACPAERCQIATLGDKRAARSHRGGTCTGLKAGEAGPSMEPEWACRVAGHQAPASAAPSLPWRQPTFSQDSAEKGSSRCPPAFAIISSSSLVQVGVCSVVHGGESPSESSCSSDIISFLRFQGVTLQNKVSRRGPDALLACGRTQTAVFPQIRRGLRSECAWIFSVCMRKTGGRERESTEELRAGSGVWLLHEPTVRGAELFLVPANIIQVSMLSGSLIITACLGWFLHRKSPFKAAAGGSRPRNCQGSLVFVLRDAVLGV